MIENLRRHILFAQFDAFDSQVRHSRSLVDGGLPFLALGHLGHDPTDASGAIAFVVADDSCC